MYKGIVSTYKNGKAKVYVPLKNILTFDIEVCEHCKPLHINDEVIIESYNNDFSNMVVLGVTKRHVSNVGK